MKYKKCYYVYLSLFKYFPPLNHSTVVVTTTVNSIFITYNVRNSDKYKYFKSHSDIFTQNKPNTFKSHSFVMAPLSQYLWTYVIITDGFLFHTQKSVLSWYGKQRVYDTALSKKHGVYGVSLQNPECIWCYNHNTFTTALFPRYFPFKRPRSESLAFKLILRLLVCGFEMFSYVEN